MVIILCAILSFYRVIKGPSLPDIIVAMNTIGVMFLLVVVLLSYYFGRKAYIDVALVYGVLLFIIILMMSKYFGTLGKDSAND